MRHFREQAKSGRVCMRYLAIDYGTKRTGLAICDPEELVASPLCVIEKDRDLVARIADIVRAEGVEAIVLGLPLNMNDSAGAQAKLVMEFGDKLKDDLGIAVYFQDERLSSFAAAEKLAATDLSVQEKRKRIDAIAAAEILQAFLEQKKAR